MPFALASNSLREYIDEKISHQRGSPFWLSWILAWIKPFFNLCFLLLSLTFYYCRYPYYYNVIIDLWLLRKLNNQLDIEVIATVWPKDLITAHNTCQKLLDGLRAFFICLTQWTFVVERSPRSASLWVERKMSC